MKDIQLALMAGIDIPISELQLVIHPPTIKDIAYMGEQEFFRAVQYLCVDKEVLIQDESLLRDLNNFQVLLKVLEQSKDKSIKTALNTLLTLLFPSYKVVMMPKSIIITQLIDGAEPVIIDETNFDVLQKAAKEVLCVSSLFQGKNIVYKPQNAAAKRIADKLMKARRKIAEQKALKEQNESVLIRYLSILTIGAKLSPQNCTNLNLFQLFDLMERYTSYVEWDTDLRVRLAGGKPEKQVESWMRNLHSMN